jgi:uncharacterized repeat protein (TIGR01451 family)
MPKPTGEPATTADQLVAFLSVVRDRNAKRAERYSLLWSVGVTLTALTVSIFVLIPKADGVAEAQSNTVDIRLIPSRDTVESGASFTINIQIEPNGQETTGVQTFMNFDPTHIQIDSVALVGPINIQLANAVDNSAGTIDLAAGILGVGPNSTFTLATISVQAKSVNTLTSISFSTTFPRVTTASILGSEMQRDLIGTTIAIGHTDPVDLDIQKTGAPQIVRAGDQLTYSIGVTNAGTTTATEVTISDALPSGMTLESASSAQGSCGSEGPNLTCNLGTMAGGSTSSIEIIAIPSLDILGDNPKNIANVTSSQIDLNTFNNTASATIEVPAVSTAGLIVLGISMVVVAFVVRARSRELKRSFHD